jgi:type IV secretion system protein VirB6
MKKSGAAVWSAKFVNSMMKIDSEGLSSQSMQQGGIGLLFTVLIVSVPPLAAMFFQGTMGNFLTYSAFGGGGGGRLGPQGQPPGSYAPPHSNTTHASSSNQASGVYSNTHATPRNIASTQGDTVKKAT